MIPTKKITPVLVLALSILLAAGSALGATRSGHWSGTVASVAGDELALVGVAERFRLAGSATELLSGRALSPSDIAPGSAVTLRLGPREADGRFRVDAVVVRPKNPLSLEGAITSVESDGRSLSVLGVRIELKESTAFSGRGRGGLVRSARDLRVGATAQVTLTATAAGTLEASSVRLMSSRGRSARALGGRSVEPGEDQEIRGTVLAVSDSAWTIDDRTFLVNAQTVFLGNPGLGDFVEVRFHRNGEGQAVADRIQKEDPFDDEVEFRGIVEAIGGASWTISGRVVQVNASTVLRGDPRIGDLVEVRADRAPDGTLTATHIHTEDGEDDDDDEREFRGIVESIGDTSWTIGGRVVRVNAKTMLLGNPRVGDFVEVHANRAADGTLTATRIETEDGDDDEREFRGVVSAIGESAWTIGELVVLVNDATEIRGDPQVGDLVEVRADRAADGTLTATRIRKEDDNGGPGGDDDGDDDDSGPGGDDDGDDDDSAPGGHGDNGPGGGDNSGPGGGD
jgi:hypothetical protein